MRKFTSWSIKQAVLSDNNQRWDDAHRLHCPILVLIALHLFYSPSSAPFKKLGEPILFASCLTPSSKTRTRLSFSEDDLRLEPNSLVGQHLAALFGKP